MRKSTAWLIPAAVVSVATLTALTLDRQVSVIPRAQAQDLDALCPLGNATLHGNYLSQGGGTITGVGPVAFGGRIHLDGKGHVTNPFTASFGGSIVETVADGTYTVNPDCSGTQVLAGTNHFSFYVSPDGSKFVYIETDAGTAINGNATRMHD
jgi:hypothetical protein